MKEAKTEYDFTGMRYWRFHAMLRSHRDAMYDSYEGNVSQVAHLNDNKETNLLSTSHSTDGSMGRCPPKAISAFKV